MKGKISLCSVIVMISAIVICSCATSAFRSVWNDSAYKGGPFKKVLVIGVDRNPDTQTMLEDRFVSRLAAKGVAAIASHTVFPEDVLPDREAVLKKIHELGIDSVLVATIVNVRDVGIYDTNPAEFNSGYYDYYLACCQSTVSEGYIVMIETKFFDAKYNKAIWSALSESALRNSLAPAINSFVSLVIGDLQDKKLLP